MFKKLCLLSLLFIAFTILGYSQVASLSVSVGGVPGTVSTQNLARSFVPIVLPDKQVDTANGWNATTNVYTIPATGLYFITTTLRLADNTNNSANFSQGVTLVGNTDGPWMSWLSFTGKRTTIVNTIQNLYTAGQQIDMLGYCDSNFSCAIASASLKIQQQVTTAGSGTPPATAGIQAWNTGSSSWGAATQAQVITLFGATGDITFASNGIATMPSINANVGSCGDATHIPVITLNAKGLATGCTVVGIAGGGGGGINPGSNGLQYWGGTAWTVATPAQIAAGLVDATKNSAYGLTTGSSGDSTLPTPTSGIDYLVMKAGIDQRSVGSGAYHPMFVNTCQPGFGDGTNAVTAGTYHTTTCRNNTGFTLNITGISCYVDTGASSCNVTNGAGTGLLTGPITGTTGYASGTQSATVTLASGDELKFTFVADGSSKQIAAVVDWNY